MSHEAKLQRYAAWLVRRGRERSVSQYVGVLRSFLSDESGFFNKINDRRLSPKYRHHLVSCLRSWAKYKKNKKLSDTLDDIRLPPSAPRGHREPLTLKEWTKIRKTIQQADWIEPFCKNVLLIVVYRGIRVGDVLRVHRNDAEEALSSGSLAFESKGGGWKHFSVRAFLGPLQGLLDAWPQDADFVREGIVIERRGGWPAWKGEEATQRAAKDAIRYTLKQLEEELDIELFAHRFRHTYADHFLREMEGDPEALFKLQSQMGWTNLATAQNYLRRSRREELAEVEEALLNKLE